MRFRKIPLATCGREWRGGRETGRRLWTESGEDDGGQTRALQQQWGDLELESLGPGCLSGEGRGRKNPMTSQIWPGTPQLDSAALDQNTTLWEDGRSRHSFSRTTRHRRPREAPQQEPHPGSLLWRTHPNPPTPASTTGKKALTSSRQGVASWGLQVWVMPEGQA